MENENVINEYLLGNLNEAEQKDFEQRLKSDQNFHEEYLMQKRMYAYLLERNNREMYSAEIDKLGDKYFPADSQKSKLSLKKILILLLVILTTSLIVWFVLKPKEGNLYETHANHFALHLVLKSDENSNAIYAESAFNKGNFEEAITSIQKYLQNNSIDTKARLALGICYLETDQNEEAYKFFDEIGRGKSTLKDYAIWYKALYFVKLSDFESAREQVGLISENDKQLFNKGQKLLVDIDNF